jgi:hypothetical protein
MQREKEEPGILDNARQGVNLLTSLCYCLTKPVEAVLRRDAGINAFKLQFAIGLVLFFCVFGYLMSVMTRAEWEYRRFGITGLCFAGLSAFMANAHRIAAWRAFKRGEIRHRWYGGDSIFERWGFSDETSKKWLEPLACMVGGLLILPLSPPLYVYLFLCGAILKGNWEMQEQRLDSRTQAHHEAMVEQQVLARRLRR